ncbi:MAG: ATP phosphoribosyltransferase regulatory subunit [Clostridia bacterium]|nr:ATP phosphoribosyltransferase regulatory subunit [Clostridia bacterium]
MQDLYKVLNNDERAVYSLRALYKDYGYAQYKMSKFEEYDLYVKNKEFLVSDSVITFTDTDGKLMALKPDVTLSIIKSNKDLKSGVKKVFYNENVYRVSKGTRAFKEIMQVGLECQGDIDEYTVTEVLLLAVKSLESISENYVLDISHLGLVSAVIDELNLSNEGKKNILSCLGEKNLEGVLAVCKDESVDENSAKILSSLTSLYGTPNKIISAIKGMKLSARAKVALTELEHIVLELNRLGALKNVNVDFSVVNDMGYYNGIVFKGFINGIPTSVLSGGQYDLLMKKMGINKGAIGFAVYLDALGKLNEEKNDFDVNTIVLYSEKTKLSAVSDAVEREKKLGASVLAVTILPDKLKYAKVIDLSKGEN